MSISRYRLSVEGRDDIVCENFDDMKFRFRLLLGMGLDVSFNYTLLTENEQDTLTEIERMFPST